MKHTKTFEEYKNSKTINEDTSSNIPNRPYPSWCYNEQGDLNKDGEDYVKRQAIPDTSNNPKKIEDVKQYVSKDDLLDLLDKFLKENKKNKSNCIGSSNERMYDGKINSVIHILDCIKKDLITYTK